MSGLVVFTMNCSSPNTQAYELLQSPSFLSGLGSKGEPGSNGIAMGFTHSIPLCCKMDLIYDLCPINVFEDLVISMPIILEGSPRSVVSHLVRMSVFIFSIKDFDVMDSNRSSTHTVIIANPSCSFQI